MEPINIQEYEDLAYERLEPTALDYYRSGAGDEVTLRANRAAFERIRLRPRVLVDVGSLSLETTALGTPLSMPIMVAPTAYHCLACEQGERDTARAAGAAETLMVASTLATRTLEEIAEVATGPLWFQLYVYKDRRVSEALVRRAEEAGYRALALTVDTPRLGRRERDVRNGFGLPSHLHIANFADPSMRDVMPQIPGASGLEVVVQRLFDQSLTWDALAWLKSITALPIVVKGILTSEDAQLAVEHGAAGIIVSNHGGRQLDGVPATIEALPEVVEAVAGRCEIYLDGGVRRGTDVLKAIALGAHGVFVGRPVLWGLAVDSAAGVERVLTLLRDELELAMALAGRPTLASIDRSLVALP
ncbi:MAG TPA: alpha-hydroxy acid oxidase [Ktedonobacterales bacterium]|jgi:isopentenyl diphosphate isomerase/L-lactate dehydrogenase-like FMN-dependent dehydrogenase